MVRVTLDMNDAGLRVLRAVAKAVDQDAARDGAIGAGVTGLACGCQLERANGSRQGFASGAKSNGAQRRRRQTGTGELDQATTPQFQWQALPRTFNHGQANVGIATTLMAQRCTCQLVHTSGWN